MWITFFFLGEGDGWGKGGLHLFAMENIFSFSGHHFKITERLSVFLKCLSIPSVFLRFEETKTDFVSYFSVVPKDMRIKLNLQKKNKMKWRYNAD